MTMTIRIRVGKQRNGTTYELAPKSRAALVEHLSSEPPPASSIFISHETRKNFEIEYGPVWEHVVGILTGLSTEEVEEIDEIVFEDPETSDILFAPRKTNVKTS